MNSGPKSQVSSGRFFVASFEVPKLFLILSIHARRMREDKYTHMTTRPVPALVMSLAGPTIVSMLVTSFYNLGDTFFVSRISTQATAAVGVSFAVMALVQAVGFMLGHGSGNFVSRKLGARETDAAARMLATGFFYGLCAGVAIAVLGHAFLRPLCRFLGSTPTILPDTEKYLGIVLFGAPVMVPSLVLNNQIRFQGNARYSMIGIVSGAVINLALDPLLIFVLGWGIAGAAWSTVIGQICSFALLLHFSSRGGGIPIRLRNFTLSPGYFKEILAGGLPSLFRQGLGALAVVCLNVSAGQFGDAAIAGMSIVNRICHFLNSALIGFGQGFQPVCGFNYGAGLYHRVRQGFWFCVKFGVLFLLVVSAAGIVFAPEIVCMFRKEDADVVRVGTAALRYQLATLPLSTWVVISNMMLQTIRKPGKAILLASARQGLFFIPFIFILSSEFGLTGVEICQPVSDLCALLLAIPLTASVLKKMK